MKLLHIPTGSVCIVSRPTNSFKVIHITSDPSCWNVLYYRIANNVDMTTFNMVLTFDITEEYWEKLKKLKPTVYENILKNTVVEDFNPDEFELI